LNVFIQVKLNCEDEDSRKNKLFDCQKNDENYKCICSSLLSHTSYKLSLITKKTNFNDSFFNYTNKIQTSIIFMNKILFFYFNLILKKRNSATSIPKKFQIELFCR